LAGDSRLSVAPCLGDTVQFTKRLGQRRIAARILQIAPRHIFIEWIFTNGFAGTFRVILFITFT
jgi:hypothetical protein